MSQGTAMNNQRGRQQIPRQVGDPRNRFLNSRYYYGPPPEYFDPPDPGPLLSVPQREEGSGGLIFVLVLVLIALAVVIYWTVNQSAYPITTSNGVIPRNTVIPEDRRAVVTDLRGVGVSEIRQVDAYELNMRERPSMNSPVKYILPRGTRVEMLNEAQQEFDGDVWIKVRIQTREGLQDGWVDARYIR